MFNNLLSINYQLLIDEKLIGRQSKVLSTTYVNFVLIPLTIREDTTNLTIPPLNPKIFKKLIWALKGDWNSFDIRLHLCSFQKVGAVGDSSTRHFNQRTKAAFRTERKEAKTIAVILGAAIVCRLPLLVVPRAISNNVLSN